MHLHEYQAKRLFTDYAIPVPGGKPARSAEGARQAAVGLGGGRCVVKAQIHAGGRGKAGGVKLAEGVDSVADIAAKMLGSRLSTRQTGADGLPVETVLVEKVYPIARELYLSALIDRASERLLFLASAAGGMEIEEVAAKHPEKILAVRINPAAGLQSHQCRYFAYGLGLAGEQVGAFETIMAGVYRLFLDSDANQVEINPLVVLEDGRLLALDAKIDLDDNALYAHPELAAMRDPGQENAKERLAREHALNYIPLDGAIGCMVNGAGLAMATMDLVKLKGGAPANFLDVGGGTTAERVAEAFKLILSDPKVRVVLVNIFGGIVRCDTIAEGLVEGVKQAGSLLPVVVRLEGTHAGAGRALLKSAGLNLIPVEDLEAAVGKAVELAGQPFPKTS